MVIPCGCTRPMRSKEPLSSETRNHLDSFDGSLSLALLITRIVRYILVTMRPILQLPSLLSSLANFSAVCVLGLSYAPNAFAEIGVDLKLGGDKPELEIKDNNINLDSSSNDDGSGSSTSSDSSDNSDSGSNVNNAGSGSSSSDGDYDPCFIHSDCTAGVGYSNDNKNSMGIGWYCKDGKAVNPNTNFDKCTIKKGCTSDSNYVGYVSSDQAWQCLEKAYIHKGCSSAPGFSQQGSLGAGWYCSDKQEVNQKPQFDPAAINAGCSQKGTGVQFVNGLWQCK